MNEVREKIQNIKYPVEKMRFLLFALVLIASLILAVYLLRVAYSRYEIRSRLIANIDKALYVFESEQVQFNILPEKMVPSDEAYTYKFSVSNYNDEQVSDVDLTYHLRIRTTTNLPIILKMYRNELPDAEGAIDLLENKRVPAQDIDGAWYYVYEINDDFEMPYDKNIEDIYTLEIFFPAEFSKNIEYANAIENIEISLESKQMV